MNPCLENISRNAWREQGVETESWVRLGFIMSWGLGARVRVRVRVRVGSAHLAPHFEHEIVGHFVHLGFGGSFSVF